MALFRGLDGNLYEIPDDLLATFQVTEVLPKDAHLSGEEIASEPEGTTTLEGSNYIWNAPTVPDASVSNYIWDAPSNYIWDAPAAPTSNYIWDAPSNYIWDAPAAPANNYIWDAPVAPASHYIW